MAIPLWRLLAGGIRSWIIDPPIGTGGTVSARYCYSVFMRHRVIAAKYGLTQSPQAVVELGPGDSLGIGLMALLTGAEKYIAIDAVRHAATESNLQVFDELVRLLKNNTPIPEDGECAVIEPKLACYDFPHDVISQSQLGALLSPSRLDVIRQALLRTDGNGCIEYRAPQGALDSVPSESIDWIFSQAVLEHVDSLEETYRQCHRCLKPTGIMTHQIDYQCHETAPEWNGHWKYPGWVWWLMRGRRPWFVNRLPHSHQRQMQEKLGFRVMAELVQLKKNGGIERRQLAKAFRAMSEQDLSTAGVMLVSKKAVSE